MFNEDALIRGCIKNEPKKQQELYEHFVKQMLLVCLRYTKNKMEAEDILQEGFVKVFQKIADFRRECPLEQWIKQIMINTALKHLRKQILVFPEEDVTVFEREQGEVTPLDLFSLQELLAMIHSLAPGYRAVFNLFAIEGYSHKEIAVLLKISEGTSKSQYARAKGLLQQMFSQAEIEARKVNV
jgi:RNA polymerase sigma factor (sigma-70 family)